MTRPNLQREGLRKAAIFVASLDRHAADLVLDQMDPQMAQIIRQLMVAIDQIDPAEQRRVFDEFRQNGRPAVQAPAPSPAPASADEALPGVEVEGSLAQQFVKTPQPAAESEAPRTPPFRFLRDTESDKLTRILMGERPQVIALVLSHLPPQQAGRVLVRLAPAVQTDVLRRLVDLEEADPEILREVERGLQSRLAEQVKMQRRRVAGLSAITGILEAADDRVGEAILQNLASHDRNLAQRLAPPPIAFDDLLRFDDRTFATVIAAADPELVLLALVGAPPEWVERFLDGMPDPQARMIRYRLDHLEPLRLSDVEEARHELAQLAHRMATQGRLRLPQFRRSPALA